MDDPGDAAEPVRLPGGTGRAKRRRRWLLGGLAALVSAALILTGVTAFGAVDSDGDGLANHVEQFGWRTLDDNIHVTDPFSADSDGDGLTDGAEAGGLVESGVYEGRSDPNRTDSDDDGLNDRIETVGWHSTRGEAYRTKPMTADSDGDGLSDGAEAGESAGTGQDIVFEVYSDPLVSDTDDDGLTDAIEADLALDAFDTDTDADGLSDAVEANVTGTAPDAADTDGDGLDDGYEVGNQEGQGLDPLWPDEQVDAATYTWEFAQGAVLGELAPGDSLPWLAGNLVSGSGSFIPGVGWVIGGVADLRDAVGAAIHADWVGAGFSVIGLVPAGGDVTAIAAKVTKFLSRHPELAPVAGATIATLGWVPQAAKATTLRAVSPEKWDELRDLGVSEESLIRLQSGKITADRLASDLSTVSRAGGVPARWFEDGYEAEAFLAGLHPGSRTQVGFSTTECAEACNDLLRRVDVLDVDDIAHESKVGYVYLTPSIRAQINSDAYLVEAGMLPGVTWHFFASAATNKVGASEPVVDLLRERGIPYVIHPPA